MKFTRDYIDLGIADPRYDFTGQIQVIANLTDRFIRQISNSLT
ncbi:MAG: hypothetical protein O3A14_19635 [Cyanobacteria bacterium]|nr:hypothetical protein [Cyanobacteriota bacterium]